jgi:ABC-2 type transport system permease protein
MKALTIAANSFRRITRDRTAMFFTVLLPFFIILIVGSATKDFAKASIPVGIYTSSSGARTTELVRALERTPSLRVTRFDDAEKLQKLLRRGVYAAGIAIPANYESAVTSGRPVRIAFIADPTRPPTAVRTAVSATVAKQGALLQAATFATANSKKSFDENLAEARKVTTVVPSIGVRTTTFGKASDKRFVMSGFEYTAPSQLILFVFITSLAGSGMIILSRQQGITRRMYGTPTSSGTIVLGETLARFAIASAQALFIVGVGVLFFGVDFGSPLAAAILILMFVLVGTATAVLAGTLFRTPEQAGAIGPALGIAMGMLAGCMWPRFIMPDAMQRLGQAFPHAWAMDAFIKLIARGGGLADIVPELAVLAAFVVALLPIATWRLRRSIVG